MFLADHSVAMVQYHLEPYAHRPQVSRGGRTGSARGLPVRPPREERTKHETKPRRNLGNHAFFNNRVFVLLIAFVFVSIAVYCLVLDHNTQEIVNGNLKENTVNRIKLRDTACRKPAKVLGVVKRVLVCCYHQNVTWHFSGSKCTI